MPVLLITDVLLFLLLIVACMVVVYIRRHAHLVAPWCTVVRSSVAMASAVVLGFYVVIGLADSLHFHPKLAASGDVGEPHYATEVLSVFDVAVRHLRHRDEKTYSAPFAAYAYAKETIEHSDGTVRHDYPRLVHGGRHLVDPPAEKRADIAWKSLMGFFYGVIAWVGVSGIIVLGFKLLSGLSFAQSMALMFGGRSEVPWRVIHLTLGVMVIGYAMLFYLSTYYHVFGTDKVGQDVFYQSLKGVRVGLAIGTLTTLVMLPFALLMGLMAGYFGGWIDDFVQYLYTTLSSIPGVLLIAAAILMLQVYMANHAESFTNFEQRADLRLLFLCMILGITNWTGLCRILRGETIKLRESDYVQAAVAFGVGHFTIIRRHLLPNVMHIVMISIVLDFSGLVLAEAVLSYINIGVDPSTHSWGNMINSARLEMAREPVVWWSLAAAFMFMFILVLAANLFADVVRDAFDPRLRGA